MCCVWEVDVASVIGEPPFVPFRKTKHPPGSVKRSVTLKRASLLTRIETSFDSEVVLVAGGMVCINKKGISNLRYLVCFEVGLLQEYKV